MAHGQARQKGRKAEGGGGGKGDERGGGNVLVSSRLGERRYKHDINGTLYLQDIIFPNIHTKFMIFSRYFVIFIIRQAQNERAKAKERVR